MFTIRTGLLAATAAGVAALLTGCNAAPVAVADSAVATPQHATTIDVLANDTDPDADPMIIKKAWGASKGDVVVNEDNTITYTPQGGASGTDEFWYRVKDNHGHAKNAKVLVTIEQPPPPRPVVIMPPPAAPASVTVTTPPSTSVTVTTPPNSGNPPVTIHATPEPATPPPSAAPPPAPITPPAPPPGTAMIQSILVTLHTTDDDKNREDPVRVVLRRGQEVVADRTFGNGELWGSNSDRAFEMTLKPEVPVGDAPLMNLDVHKPATGGPGAGWAMQVDLQGRLSDGRTVVLLPQTEPVKMGDGQPNDRTWTIPAIK